MTVLGNQFAGLLGPMLEAVRRLRLHNLWIGAAAAVLVAGLAMAFRTRSGHAFLMAYAITHPSDPLYVMLLKLPLSMVAPAALLPFWFSVLQVFVVYTLAQTLLGGRRTHLVAVSGHTLATLSTGVWMLVGPPIGVGHLFDHFADGRPLGGGGLPVGVHRGGVPGQLARDRR